MYGLVLAVAGILIICISAWSDQDQGNLNSTEKMGDHRSDLKKSTKKIILMGASYVNAWHLKNVAGMEVVNKGIDGQQSFEFLSRFRDDVLSLQPEAVIIWGFINDIHRSNRKNMESTIDKIKSSYEKMIALSRDAGIETILASEVTIRPEKSFVETIMGLVGRILGKQSYQDYVNRQVVAVNNWLKNYAEQNNLMLLDFQTLLSDEKNMRKKKYATKDGTHVSSKGYEVLTAFTQKHVPQLFGESPGD